MLIFGKTSPSKTVHVTIFVVIFLQHTSVTGAVFFPVRLI